MLSVRDSVDLVRHLGAGWVLRRAAYAARRRLGGLERAMPRRAWSEIAAPSVALTRCTSPVGLFARVDASAIERGEFVLFSHRRVTAGHPPEWARNQLTGELVPRDAHWSRLGDFSFGDIKGVWELSRFGWAFDLVRDGRPAAAGTFWRLWSDWMRHNPPNSGPNWMCGQEASIRLMAVVFAAERFGVPAEHQEAFGRFVLATGQRVRANLAYALAQQNNHGVSECVGLLTAALLLPEHPASAAWRRLALDRLRAQVEELVYEDGAFSQHSAVYHRVMLHQLCWAAVRLQLAQEKRPEWLDAAGRRATGFLAAITDPGSGEPPLYGANDGANLLPLATAEYLDFRPAVQLGAALFEGRLRYAAGPWDEPVAWLAREALEGARAESALADRHAAAGGLLQLVAGDLRLVMRCPTQFRHRPSHGDFGHVDVWLAGRRVAFDGGSFSYNSRERFVHLGDAREHNALAVEGLAPMRKVTRFLQLPWPQGTMRETAPGVWCYRPQLYPAAGLAWERTVARGDSGGFVVRDAVTGAAGRALRWHWRLADAEWVATGEGVRAKLGGTEVALVWKIEGPVTVQLLRADPASAAGWQSRHYGAVEPAVSLVLTVPGAPRRAAEFTFSVLSR